MDAQAARDAGDLILSGALLDDAGQALANESLAISLAREADPRQIVSFFDEGRAARSCTAGFHDNADPRPTSAGGPVVLVTDEAGRFCVRVTVPRDKYVATIAWGGKDLVEGTKLDLPVDTGRQAIVLRFDPEPRIVSLDKRDLSLQIAASYEENQTTHAGANLPVYVTNERGDPLGGGATNGAGVFRISIPAERLGPPGRGELRASFPGNDELTKSLHIAPIERHARVQLVVAEPQGRKAESPEDGLPLSLTARTRAGAVPTGSVEVVYGDAVVGAAPLENGAATLVATFATPQESDVELRVRYLPSAPWFLPGEEAIVRVPVKGPSPLRHLPLALAGIGVVLWLLLGRIKRAPSATKSTEAPKPAIEGEARVQVVRSSRDARSGWSGRVVDAHEGTPVQSARVRIERPGFERAAVVASAFANEMGRFELRVSDGVDGFDELVVEGPLHAELRQPLPKAGELEIALVLRKRKLLERLVAWAKRRGRPFDASPEPTPAHVRRAAANDFGTARWADAVEKAAYGGGDVDARLEAEVQRLAPEARPGEARPAEAAVGDPGLTVRDLPPQVTVAGGGTVRLDPGSPPPAPPRPGPTPNKT